jgi:pimeloyl-ACP methyl ester carboxylesterase
MSLQTNGARLAMRALQRAAPGLAAALAERWFFTPPRTPLSPQVAELLRSGRRFSVVADGQRIAGWSWGRGPVVLLVHGWGGRGGRLAAAYVVPLVRAGFSAVAFDAPGHGASDGRLSSLPQFARALEAVADAAGTVYGIVAHSMGGSASTLALSRGLPLERAAFIAPAANPARFAAAFADSLGVSPAAMTAMRERSERRLGIRWADLEAPVMARDLDVPLLVIHDRDDPTVPWTDGAAIAAAWPGAELVTTEGLGHRDVVREASVVNRIVAFLSQGSSTLADDCGNAVTEEGRWVERDLFRRADRQRRIFQA